MRLTLTRPFLPLVAVSAFAFAACEQGAAPNLNGNSNTNVLSSNRNADEPANANATGGGMIESGIGNSSGNNNPAGSNPTNGNTNSNSNTGNTSSSLNTREPDRYRATLVIGMQAGGGGQSRSLPQVTAQVARDSANRRFAVSLPGNSQQFVFLDRADKRYIIMPNQRQYGELSSASIGFDPARTMTPGQLVERLQQQPGIERVGEEQRNGRQVTKYRYARAGQTNTAAGQAQSESVIYVDNQTGLPLYAEINAQAQGNVQGMNQARIIMEMRDISTDIDAAEFEIPQGFQQLTPEQMRQQVQGLMQLAQMFAGMMSNGGGMGAAR